MENKGDDSTFNKNKKYRQNNNLPLVKNIPSFNIIHIFKLIIYIIPC